MTEENPDNKNSNIVKAFQAPSTSEETANSEPIISLKLLQKIETIEKYFQGPLPPPEILAEYDKLMPGCAKEIIGLFTKQANHRMDLEKTVVKGDSKRAYLGIGCAFIISLVVIWLSYTLIIKGHGIAGAILGGLDLATLAGVFIYGTTSRRKERAEKEAMTKKK